MTAAPATSAGGVWRATRTSSGVAITAVAVGAGLGLGVAARQALGRRLAATDPGLAGHWAFGGDGSPAGVAELELTPDDGAGFAFRGVVQIFNPGPEKAVVTLTPRSSSAGSESVQALLHGIAQSKEGFAITDREGRFTYMNPEHLRMFGYEQLDEVVGRSWKILYEPEEARRIAQEIFPDFAARGSWHGVTRARRRDGTIFSEDLTLSLLPDGGITCNCRDRTAENDLQERVGRSEQLFRTFTENVPSGIFIRRPQGGLHYVNRRAADLLGIPAADLLGRPFREVVPPGFAQKLRESAGRGVQHQEIAVRLNGRDRVLDAVEFPLCDRRGHVEFICSIYTDVTARKHLERESAKVTERQTELVTMQREFVSLISHEFRTPLTAMQGAHFLLRKRLAGNMDEKVLRYLELQGESMTALKELVDQVLFLNRLEHSTGELTPVRIVAADRITSIIDRFNSTTINSEPRLEPVLSLPAGCELEVDESLFRAALENIISNALKYSPAGQKVRVEATLVPGHLQVAVTDRGRGIPPSEHAKVFQPFFRASNVGITPGTGLGLAIVKRAVDFHRGRVTFESAPDTGTTFRLLFPLPTGPAPAESTPPHEPTAAAAR